MIRQLISTALMLLAMAGAYATEAGRIVFVVGEAKVAGHPAKQGDAVNEGDEIRTGGDAYVYLKTIDNGFLILRPSSHARIINYHVDHLDPKNTRIKLELLNGVARSISGEAVKKSRQNFRFNTPVAAIGVRGTDFTVFTDAQTSRVAVISGGVIVAGFAGSCGPEGNGPCEGNASRELFANQVGQMLQVQRGNATPQMMPSTVNSQDGSVPARPEEPISSGNTPSLASNDLNLDPQKDANLQRQQNSIPTPTPTPPTPPVVTPPLIEVQPSPPAKEITWGRWQAVLGQKANFDLGQYVGKSDTVAMNNYFAIFRSKQGSSVPMPERDKMGFQLMQSEAYMLDQKSRVVTPGVLENGKLQVDFGSKAFNTSFDFVNASERLNMQAIGELASDGRLYGNSQFSPGTNMIVNGILDLANNPTAYYLFQAQIKESNRLISGATVWGK